MTQESTEAEDATTPIRAGDYIAPVLNRKAFHCPHCGVYAPQEWEKLRPENPFRSSHITQGTCFNCRELTYWQDITTATVLAERPAARMVFPEGSASAPPPHVDFPGDAKVDYEEARAIVDRSPRGAAALLRLAVQKLMVDLGEQGKNINDDIASLARKGLAVEVQQALDALRVIGNSAVHPGELDLKDDRDTATALFGVLNYIVEQRISQPKRLQALYGMLPSSAVAAIQKRDGQAMP